jgi:tetratricopeptide (TPR) repeat protein
MRPTIVVLLGLLLAGGPHAIGGVAREHTGGAVAQGSLGPTARQGVSPAERQGAGPGAAWALADPVARRFAHPAADQPHADPVEILLEAVRARDAGRADSLEAAWTAALRRRGDDRRIRLGLAGLARLTARPARADSILSSLGARDLASPDPISLWAAAEMAEGLRLRGQFAEARPLFEAAGAWARELGLPSLEARTAFGLVGVLTRLEGQGASQPHRTRLLQLRDDADPWLRAVLACQDAQGLQGTASQIRDEVEAVTSAAQEAGFPHLAANCLSALYQRFRSEGQVDSTLAVLDRMEALARGAGDRTTLAAVLQWRSDVYPSVGAYGSASRYAMEAVEEGRAGGNLSAAAWAHLTLASVGRATGDLAGALGQLAEARQLFQQQGDRWGELYAWRRQAHVDALAGRHTEARRTLEEILPELVSGYGRGEGAFILLDLLDMAVAAGDAPRADSLLPLVRQELEATGNGGWVPGLAWRETHVALALGDLPRARAAAERTLAGTRVATSRYLALSDLALVRLREGDGEGAAEALEEGLRVLSDWRASVPVERLKTSAFALTRGFDPTPPDPTASVVAALVETGAVDRALALAEGQRARSLLESVLKAESFATGEVAGSRDLLARVTLPQAPDPPGEERILRSLPPGTAALLTVTGGPEEPSTAFVLTRDTLLAVPLPPAGELASLVERLAVGLRSGLWLMAPGDELSWVVARPVMEALPPEVTTLVWVPDGPLHALPLDALAHPRGGRVLDHLAVARTPSLSVLGALLERSRVGNGRVVALADPGRRRGGPGGLRSSSGTYALPPLPGSRKEAAMVSRLGSPGLLLRGPAASEVSFRRLAAPERESAGLGVLHLATHAVVDPDSPSGTALVLAPGSGEDGLLTPAELATLRLKADLVVLSACATAGGLNLRGEGIQGLVAPLLGGGVRVVVATSWEIPDRMPVPLMESFYRELAGGTPVAEAMRRAKQEAMEMGASPAVWAAFQVVGDPSVTPVLRTRAALLPGGKLAVALLGLLALLGLAAVFRRVFNAGP